MASSMSCWILGNRPKTSLLFLRKVFALALLIAPSLTAELKKLFLIKSSIAALTSGVFVTFIISSNASLAFAPLAPKDLSNINPSGTLEPPWLVFCSKRPTVPCLNFVFKLAE